LWYEAPNELPAGGLVTEERMPSLLMMHGQTNIKTEIDVNLVLIRAEVLLLL
jgi:hypothetical protein